MESCFYEYLVFAFNHNFINHHMEDHQVSAKE